MFLVDRRVAVFHRGDVDESGQVQITDAVRILGCLFLDTIGSPSPGCESYASCR